LVDDDDMSEVQRLANQEIGDDIRRIEAALAYAPAPAACPEAPAPWPPEGTFAELGPPFVNPFPPYPPEGSDRRGRSLALDAPPPTRDLLARPPLDARPAGAAASRRAPRKRPPLDARRVRARAEQDQTGYEEPTARELIKFLDLADETCYGAARKHYGGPDPSPEGWKKATAAQCVKRLKYYELRCECTAPNGDV